MAPRSRGGEAQWSEWTALVGDSVRVRLLRLLEREELGVGEIARVVQLPQSTVSRHLKLLFDSQWVARRNQGTAGIYRTDVESRGETARALWRLSRTQLDAAQIASDDSRLAGVLTDRRTDSRTFFGRVGGEWDALRRELFGTLFAGESLLSLIDPEWTVADIGCGTGDAAEHLAPIVRRVIAIDREPLMLDAARRRLAAHRNVLFREGDLLELPLKDGEVDAAVVMLVLHHVPQPRQAIAECARTLAPEGRLLIVDMIRHDREIYARTMGHLHLGFKESDVRAWCRGADLTLSRWHMLRADSAGKGPGLFAALLTRSA